MEAIVVKENTRRGIDVRIWILGLECVSNSFRIYQSPSYLSMLFQYSRRNLRVLLYQLEDRIVGDLWPSGGEVHQSFETRIWFTEHGVPVTWHDLARFQSAPEIIFDVLF